MEKKFKKFFTKNRIFTGTIILAFVVAVAFDYIFYTDSVADNAALNQCNTEMLQYKDSFLFYQIRLNECVAQKKRLDDSIQVADNSNLPSKPPAVTPK